MLSLLLAYTENTTMGQVIVRNLDDEVIERLKAKAAAQNQSLEQALRDIVSASVNPTRSEVLQEMDRIRQMTPTKLTTDSADLIREARAER
jgi:antitoxin FitA